VTDALDLYQWAESDKPILDLHSALNHDPSQPIAVACLTADGEWENTNVDLQFADVFAATQRTSKQVYIPVNENADLERGPNPRGDETTITRVKALWADLDFKSSGVGSPAAAKSVIDTLSGILNATPVAVVYSGGGYQPDWEVEEGEILTKEDRAEWKGMLRSWGTLVKTVAAMDGGKADSVFDLPRVLRAPGTLNLKGADPVQTRLHLPPWSTPVSADVLRDALEAYGIPINTEEDPREVVAPPSEWEPAEHDCPWTPNILDEITAATPDARHPWLIDQMVTLYAAMRNGCITQDSFNELFLTLTKKFEYLLQQGEKRNLAPREIQAAAAWAKHRVSTLDTVGLAGNLNYHTHLGEGLRLVGDLPKEHSSDAHTSSDGLTATATIGNTALQPLPDTRPAPATAAAVAESLSHVGNARRLLDYVDGHYINVPGVGWHRWDGARWVLDETRSIEAQHILAISKFINAAATDKALVWANKSFMQGNIEASIKAAGAMATRKMDEFDANPYELCTPAGIVDLVTGVFRQPDRKRDFNTKQTTIAPAPGPTPMWDAFLKRIIEDDERILFLQELFGLALIGEVLEHIFPLFVGVGRNGKSTLLEILGGILGDYAITLNEGFFVKGRHKEHSSELAQLHGVRFAFFAETDPDAEFNEPRVKEITGGDTIRARYMGKDFFSLRPSWTVMGSMNHLPKVSSGGDSFFRRTIKVDFNVQIPEAEVDGALKAKILAQEGAGVLQWMIEGAKRYLDRQTLTKPASVVLATAEYRHEEDHIARFIAERCSPNQYQVLAGREIYAAYSGWCAANGEKAMSKTQLFREVLKRLSYLSKTGQDEYTGLVLFED